MAYGLAVWGPDGAQWIGGPDRICRYQGVVTFGGNDYGSNNFISFPGFRTDGTWFYICVSDAGAGTTYVDYGPMFRGGGDGYLVPTTDGFWFYARNTYGSSSGYYRIYVWRG